MPKKTPTDTELVFNIRKADTPEGRERQIIAEAYDLAERRILDGSASDTLLKELIKVGSTRERLEREILEKQRDLISAKTDAMKAQKRVDELYAEALDAFKSYHGDTDEL
jgi:hypothetical protein